MSLADQVEAAKQEKLERRIQINAVEAQEFGGNYVRELFWSDEQAAAALDEDFDRSAAMTRAMLMALIAQGNETNRLLARVSSQLNAMER